MEGKTPAGWYTERNALGQARYWDGAKWTEQTRRAQESGTSAGATTRAQFDEQVLQELQTANQLLAGIRARTGVVAAVIWVSLGIVLFAVLNGDGGGSTYY